MAYENETSASTAALEDSIESPSASTTPTNETPTQAIDDAKETSAVAIANTAPNADVATDEDKLFRNDYARGVAAFIKTCPTPMTIALKGDWGTGKTSLINQIEPELRSQAAPAEDDDPNVVRYCPEIINVATIDVSHQSKDAILKNLLRDVVEKLSGNSLSAMEKVSEFANVASQIVGAVLLSNDDNSEGESKDENKDDSGSDTILGLWAASDDDSKSEGESEGGYDINELKNMFTEALQEAAQEYGKSEDSRLVVFVDGLDHINPETAVDLMEQIKSHLNSPRCIFVFAVDERIAYEGIRKKLGEKIEENRKKMYFDKLIQVPLRIPSSAYNLNMLIKSLLKDKQELAGEFAEVINTLVIDPTPRRIERYINTMHLYRNAFGGPAGMEDSSLSMLFAAVILEIESAQGFDAVAACARGDEAHFAENLKEKLGSLKLDDGINWAMLPALWHGGEGIEGDAAKRSAFLFWVLKLK